MNIELNVDYVWCDVHGEIHDANIDPYGYGYDLSGDGSPDDADRPECGPDEWRAVGILGPFWGDG